jgi:hypothetical protein
LVVARNRTYTATHVRWVFYINSYNSATHSLGRGAGIVSELREDSVPVLDLEKVQFSRFAIAGNTTCALARRARLDRPEALPIERAHWPAATPCPTCARLAACSKRCSCAATRCAPPRPTRSSTLGPAASRDSSPGALRALEAAAPALGSADSPRLDQVGVAGGRAPADEAPAG